MTPQWKVPFGDLKIGPSTRRRINDALDRNWVSEGPYVREFEERFAEKFGWNHAIAVSSGTDAGIVVWSAIRNLEGVAFGDEMYVVTPASTFTATANCILAAGLQPAFVDINLHTLNMSVTQLDKHLSRLAGATVGIQFIANVGNPEDIDRLPDGDPWIVADWCEGHGATIDGKYADHHADASIYSLYTAHLIVGGEGGVICTNSDPLADLCRSIKSHGRPTGSTFFDFQRIGYNSKWNDLCAAVALEGLERFDETFEKRRVVRRKLMEAIRAVDTHESLLLYDDRSGHVIAPHAFPIVLKHGDRAGASRLYAMLEGAGVQTKTLFGSLPTQHKAFEYIGWRPGDFPVAEYVGNCGLHFGCHEYITDADVGLIAGIVGDFLKG